MRVLVTGGYFDDSGSCFIDEVDLETGSTRRLVDYVPETSRRVATKGFTGAVWTDDQTLMVCSFNAVHRFDASVWRETGRLAQPDFNDLHHVGHDGASGQIYVCNTGLDAIEVFDASGTFVGRHATSPAWFERERQEGAVIERARYSDVLSAGWDDVRVAVPRVRPAGQYYEGDATRAFHCSVVRDYLHPNHVVMVDGRLAVTMLASREVRCMRSFERLASTEGHPHDGQVEGERFWTTSTHGRVSAWHRGARPWREVERYEVFDTGWTGWCRGLLVTGEVLVVGMTEMRSAPQYTWCDRPLSETSTCLVVVERGTGRLVRRIMVGEADRHPKVFSILEARG